MALACRQGLGFRAQGLGFGVLGFRVRLSGFQGFAVFLARLGFRFCRDVHRDLWNGTTLGCKYSKDTRM